MASGRLGTATLAANTDTVVYTVPAGMVATLNVSVVNRGDTLAAVNVAVSTSGAAAAADYIESGAIVPGHGVLERSAVVVGAGERVIVRSTTANCSVRVHGFEEAA